MRSENSGVFSDRGGRRRWSSWHSPAASQRETRERGITVGVSTSGSSDAPVTDMKVTDFTRARKRRRARSDPRLSPPRRRLTCTARSTTARRRKDSPPYLRPALTEVRSASWPRWRRRRNMALMTFGERPTRRVDFTPNSDPLVTAANRLFPVTGVGRVFSPGDYGHHQGPEEAGGGLARHLCLRVRGRARVLERVAPSGGRRTAWRGRPALGRDAAAGPAAR